MYKKIVQIHGIRVKTQIIGIDSYRCQLIIEAEGGLEAVVFETYQPIETREDFDRFSGIFPVALVPENGLPIEYDYQNKYALFDKAPDQPANSPKMKFVKWITLEEIINIAQTSINEIDIAKSDQSNEKSRR